jgi:hypothetical protein
LQQEKLTKNFADDIEAGRAFLAEGLLQCIDSIENDLIFCPQPCGEHARFALMKATKAKARKLILLGAQSYGDNAIAVDVAFQRLATIQFNPPANACVICRQDFGILIA